MKIILLLFIIFVFTSQHSPRVIKDFIYKHNHPGLINFDYGIISVEDLNIADRDSFPATQFDGSNLGYPYWQCFNKKYLRMDCNYSYPMTELGSSLGINIKTGSAVHFYSLSHAISGDVCSELKSKIWNVLKNKTYFCINGTYGKLERTVEKNEYSWTFYRLKTNNGYVHYMSDE